MADFNTLTDKLAKAYGEIARLEHSALEKGPDQFVLLQLSSLKRMATQLENEWKEISRFRHHEVCLYRVIDPSRHNFSVSPVFRSLATFQSLFSQVFDALSTQPKERARISVDIEQQTDLKLAYTFPGSLGFALYSESHAGLFEEQFHTTAKAVADVMATEDEHHVRDLAVSLGQAVVKRIYDWSKANADAHYGVDLKWRGITSDTIEIYSSSDHFENLVKIIEKTVDQDETDLDVEGVLLGIDIHTRRFRMHAQPSGEDFSGKIHAEFDLTKDWTVNQKYRAKIKSVHEIYYATLETKVSYELLSLSQWA